MSYPPVLILIIEGWGAWGGGGVGGGGWMSVGFFCPVVRLDCLMKSSTSYRNVHSDNAKMKTRVCVKK